MEKSFLHELQRGMKSTKKNQEWKARTSRIEKWCKFDKERSWVTSDWESMFIYRERGVETFFSLKGLFLRIENFKRLEEGLFLTSLNKRDKKIDPHLITWSEILTRDLDSIEKLKSIISLLEWSRIWADPVTNVSNSDCFIKLHPTNFQLTRDQKQQEQDAPLKWYSKYDAFQATSILFVFGSLL